MRDRTDDVTELARRLGESSDGRSGGILRSSWWSDRMLGWAMNHPSFRSALFRFVDVFPATLDDADVSEHLREYLDDADTPRVVALGLDVSEHLPMGEHLTASIARRSIARMGEQFIIGRTPQEAMGPLHDLWRSGRAFTVDLLGEHTVGDADAERYLARLDDLLTSILSTTPTWAPNARLEQDDRGPIPRASISIKPTAVAPAFDPVTRLDGIAQAKERLRPFLLRAAENNVSVWFDMEHYDVKELTQTAFRELMGEPSLAGLHGGIVVQAYLRDSHDDLTDLIDWARGRSTPIGVRLVKGAYWDTETVRARAAGWPVPVYEDKVATDANYERCVELLHANHAHVRAAFGSHNLRSLAFAIATARRVGIPDDGYEIQLLHGMADPIHRALVDIGARVRVYAPIGELVPGMAYLVRRLLENTSNESFVRMRFHERRSLEEQLSAPALRAGAVDAAEAIDRDRTQRAADADEYQPEPLAEFRRGSVWRAFGEAVARVDHSARGLDVPAVISGEPVHTGATITSVDPGDHGRVVAVSADCGIEEAERALVAARAAWPDWQRRPAAERAAALRRTAEWLRARRFDLAALEVFEAGKPWAEADADVCEAIDFCEYYAREALRLAAGGAVASPPGETNVLRYQGRGIAVVISPWNFPLAICTGMVTAALVTGNAVLFKPAEQTPAIASKLVEGLLASGVPNGVVAFLPGRGEVVGAHLVAHRDVSLIAFTGSLEVGLGIIQAAARVQDGQQHVKRVIAEMGGKNAIVVDSDADLDQAVPAIVHSAFGFAGQKCSAASRVVVVESMHDELVARLLDATAGLRVGHPRDPNVVVGPVIDGDAYSRIVGTGASGTATTGWYVEPHVALDVAPGTTLVTDEIFGPVIALQRATDFDDAIRLANSTPYALTAGLFSRSPAHIARAGDELRAGNVYVNRGITGAIVGRQPFGGYGLSGVGSKAGGPDYLLQFVDPRVVTENTVRQGFVPEST